MVKSQPINIRSAQVSFIILGLMTILSGLNLLLNKTLLGFDISPFGLGLILFGVVIIGYSEIGLKRFSSISKLKRLSPQQKVTLGFNTFILFIALVFMIFGNVLPQVITGFTHSVLILSGASVILEAFR